jgi:hypothetical protein
MSAATTGRSLFREGGGGQIHGPEHQSRGGEVDSAGVYDAEDFGAVQGEVAPVHGHTNPRNAGEAAGTGNVVETGAGVEMMAAAGASANGGAVAVVAIGKSVAAETDDQARIHRDLRRVKRSG